MICLPYAISDKQGELEFEVSKCYQGVHRVKRKGVTDIVIPIVETEKRQIVKVPSDTLEHLLLKVATEFVDNIRLIWIDIQRYEGYAFQGAETFFSRNIPVVTELWPYGILSGGMTFETYCRLAKRFWQYYWALDEAQEIIDKSFSGKY